MALTRRQFLTIGAIGAVGAAHEAFRHKTGINPAKEFVLTLQEPTQSSLTYNEVIPRSLIATIEEKIGTFGFADLLAKEESYETRAEGIYFVKPKNARHFDCFSSSRDISDVIAAHSHQISNYAGHSIQRGYDKRGVNTDHSWVEIYIKDGWVKNNVTIDMTPHFRGSNPQHVAINKRPSSNDSSINLVGAIISSSYWEDASGNGYMSGMGIQAVEGNPSVLYTISEIPKDPSQEVTRYEMAVDIDSSKVKAVKFMLKMIKDDGRDAIMPKEQQPLPIDYIKKLMPQKDLAALRTMTRVYTGRNFIL